MHPMDLQTYMIDPKGEARPFQSLPYLEPFRTVGLAERFVWRLQSILFGRGIVHRGSEQGPSGRQVFALVAAGPEVDPTAVR